MNYGDIIQSVAAFAFVGGAAYWGGQVKNAICALSLGQADHENRIRVIEHGSTVPVRVD